MPSWLTGGAREWNEQLRATLNQAATSVQRLAEQAEGAAEAKPQQRAPEPAATGPAGDWSLGSAFGQIYCSAQRIAEQVSEQGEAALREAEATLREAAEQAAKEVSSLGLVPSDGMSAAAASENVEELARAFEREAQALESSGGRPAQEPIDVLRAWDERMRGVAGGRGGSAASAARQKAALSAFLRSRAAHLAPALLVRSRAGRKALRAAGGGGDSTPGAAPTPAAEAEDAEAGALLLSLLNRASRAPRPLLRQLLDLLADAAEESARAAKQSVGKDAVVASRADAAQDLQWLLALVSATFREAGELEPEEVAALEAAAGCARCGEGDSIQPEGEGAATLTPGIEVWAVFPGDGCSYRARINGKLGTDGCLDVAWSRRPAEEAAGDAVLPALDEYLASTGADELQFLRLPSASLSSVEGPRPQAPTSREHWVRQLEEAEACAKAFHELRGACQSLAAKWAAPRADTEPQPSAALASHLAALREEGELRAAALAGRHAEFASFGSGVQERLESSSRGVDTEVKALEQHQDALRARVAELRRERAELLARLRGLDDQLAMAEEAQAEAASHAEAVRASAARVAAQLQLERSSGEQDSRRIARRHRLLLEAGAASRDVESLLGTRCEEGADLDARRARLLGRRGEIVAACLRSERQRGERLEELLAGWHAAVYGPGAAEFARDPARVATLRALHDRAGSALEKAWRETVQLAAQTLGGEGESASASEHASRAAERYRAMRQQLHANLERVASLEAAARQPARAAPAAALDEEVQLFAAPRAADAASAAPPAATTTQEAAPGGAGPHAELEATAAGAPALGGAASGADEEEDEAE